MGQSARAGDVHLADRLIFGRAESFALHLLNPVPRQPPCYELPERLRAYVVERNRVDLAVVRQHHELVAVLASPGDLLDRVVDAPQDAKRVAVVRAEGVSRFVECIEARVNR